MPFSRACREEIATPGVFVPGAIDRNMFMRGHVVHKHIAFESSWHIHTGGSKRIRGMTKDPSNLVVVGQVMELRPESAQPGRCYVG